MRQRLSGLALILCTMVCGCGGKACSVSGKVLWNGNPVPEGRIALRPKAAKLDHTVQAVIENGEFNFVRQQGVVTGTYDVVITARRKTGQTIDPEEGSEEAVERYEQYLPAKYNTKTTLVEEISGDVEDLVFELKE